MTGVFAGVVPPTGVLKNTIRSDLFHRNVHPTATGQAAHAREQSEYSSPGFLRIVEAWEVAR